MVKGFRHDDRKQKFDAYRDDGLHVGFHLFSPTAYNNFASILRECPIQNINYETPRDE